MRSARTERTGYHPDSGWLVTVVGRAGQRLGPAGAGLPGAAAAPRRSWWPSGRRRRWPCTGCWPGTGRAWSARPTARCSTELLAPGALPRDLTARAAALGVPLAGTARWSAWPSGRGRPQARRRRRRWPPRSCCATWPRRRRWRPVGRRCPALVGGRRRHERAGAARRRPQADVDAGAAQAGPRHPPHGRSRTRAHVPVVVAVGTTVTAGGRRAPHAGRGGARGAGGAAHPRRDRRLPPAGRRPPARPAAPARATTSGWRPSRTRELGPLLASDTRAGSRLVDALRHYCEQGGNKSAAAAAAHLSRTAYYQQLARIEQVLGCLLEDPESMLSLYVALLAVDAGDR